METIENTEAVYRNQQTVEAFKANHHISTIRVEACKDKETGDLNGKLRFVYGPASGQVGYVAKSLAEDLKKGSLSSTKAVIVSEISQNGGAFVPTMHYEGVREAPLFEF